MKLTREYIAGLFDGEGNAYVRENIKNAPSIQISITNTNREVLDRIQKTLSYGCIQTQKASNNREKPVYRWRIFHHITAKNFLNEIMPFLIRYCQKLLILIN